MADSNDAGIVTEVAATAEPKKRRGPRSKALAVEKAVPAVSDVSAKPARTRKKVDPKPAAAKVPVSVKPTRKAKPAKVAPITSGDEFSDLLKLEEENKGLRKALSEKLRAENTELRKRLGQA